MRLLATTYSFGAAKAGWILLIVLVPLVGVLCYVLVRGDKMKEHEAAA